MTVTEEVTEKMPAVSLVMTVYNMDRYVERSLKSALAQTFQDWELIVWDDGSTDESGAIAQHYAAQDKRIRFFQGEENIGQGRALQKAHELTRGEFVGWLDADDWLAPTALQETVDCLRQNPDYGMVYTDHVDVDEKGVAHGLGYRCQIPFSSQRLLVDLLVFHFRLVRQSVFSTMGGFNLEIKCAEDYDLFLRISEIAQIYHLQRSLYFYLRNSQGLSSQRMMQQRQGSAQAVRLALKRRGLEGKVYLDVDNETGRFRLKRCGKAQLEKVTEAKSWFSQGKVHMQKGEFSAAVDCFGRAVELRENYIAAYNQLGKTYQLMGQGDQALTVFKQLLEINPYLAEAHCNLGAVWETKGDFEDAITAYGRAISIKPNLTIAHLNLTNLLSRQAEP